MKAAIITFVIIMIFTCWVQDSGQRVSQTMRINGKIENTKIGCEKQDRPIGEVAITDYPGDKEGTGIVTGISTGPSGQKAQFPYLGNK